MRFETYPLSTFVSVSSALREAKEIRYRVLQHDAAPLTNRVEGFGFRGEGKGIKVSVFGF